MRRFSLAVVLFAIAEKGSTLPWPTRLSGEGLAAGSAVVVDSILIDRSSLGSDDLGAIAGGSCTTLSLSSILCTKMLPSIGPEHGSPDCDTVNTLALIRRTVHD